MVRVGAGSCESRFFKTRGINTIATESAHSVSVPGAVASWHRLVADHGTMEFPTLLKPEIEAAEQAYPVTERVARDWAKQVNKLARNLIAARLLLNNGALPQPGTIHRQPALAAALRSIAFDGTEAFYEGWIARDNPAEAVGEIARQHNCFTYLMPARQVGQMAINVKLIGCDVLFGTGRKFLRDPRGTGFLYVRRDLLRALEPPFIDLHAATCLDRDHYVLRDDARRFENWESYVAGRIGLRQAVRYALDLGLERIEAQVNVLADQLREGLNSVPSVTVWDRSARRCGIVTFTKDGEAPDLLAKRLRASGVNVSVSFAAYARLDLD